MKYIFCILLCLFSLSIFAEEPTLINLNSQSAHLILKLPANPTTGFRWRVKSYDNTLFALTKSQYRAVTPSRIGSGGEMVFVFTCLHKKDHPQYTSIQFEYARPWTTSGATLKKVKIKLQ